jgi:hypothetical protein
MLQDFSQLFCPTLVVAVLFVWQISLGGRNIHQGLRHLVDCLDRNLNVFQINLRFNQEVD